MVSQSGTRYSHRARLLFGAALLAALVVAAVPTLLYPLTRDQGIYAYIADVMMDGGVPYRDVWELKPPGVYFAYQLAFSLFGRSEFAIRLFDVLYTLVSAASVYLLAWEVFRDRCIAVGAAWIYAFSYYLLVHFHSAATPEAFMTPFLVVGVYGVVRGVQRKSRRALIYGGIASGLVFWFKPTAGLVVVAVLIWAYSRMRREGRAVGAALRSLAWVVGGALLGLLIVGIYLVGHGLRELLEIWWAYGTGPYLEARGLALGDGPLAVLDVIVQYLRDWQLLVWLSLAAAIGILVRRERAATVVVAFWVSGVVATLVQGKFFEYHWIPVLAPAAMLSSVALIRLGREIVGRSDMRSIFSAVVVVGLLLWMGYDQLPRYRRLFAYQTGGLSAEQYYAQFDIGGDFSRVGTHRAATYLRERSEPDETVLVWGVEPLVNFLAQRRSPTNYVSFYVLIGGETTNPRFEAWRQDFLGDIREAPPRYIVLVENDVTPLAPSGSLGELAKFPAFESILEAGYDLEAQVEDYLFYRRR